VPSDGEPLETHLSHHLDLVASQLAHRVRAVVVGALGLPAVAVPSQVGGDDRELLGQRGRHPMPHEMGLGDAVQKEQRRTLAATTAVDGRLADSDVERLEALEHADRLSR
jgi:hypothetical protein